MPHWSDRVTLPQEASVPTSVGLDRRTYRTCLELGVPLDWGRTGFVAGRRYRTRPLGR